MDATILGVVIGLLGAVLVQFVQHLNEKQRTLARRHEEKLLDPIIAFVDEILEFMSDYYWRRVEGQEEGLVDRIDSLRIKETSVQARVAALDDARIAEAYESFDAHIGDFRAAVIESDFDQAHKVMKGAAQAAGLVMQLLLGVTKKHRKRQRARVV